MRTYATPTPTLNRPLLNGQKTASTYMQADHAEDRRAGLGVAKRFAVTLSSGALPFQPIESTTIAAVVIMSREQASGPPHSAGYGVRTLKRLFTIEGVEP